MSDVAQFVAEQLSAAADSEKAVAMARYMKTTMPFYGVQKPAREAIMRRLKAAYRPHDGQEYTSIVLDLWSGPHREEKYLAIRFAMAFDQFVTLEQFGLFERLIREGAWWDFVDDIAIRLVGPVMLSDRDLVGPVMDGWIADSDMWIRRSAIICQLKHKTSTDEDRLFGYCLDRASESEFFIRKAIGWALREYAKVAPEKVAVFLLEHYEAWSALTFREASKHLTIQRPQPGYTS
jgi:3-methyladenine DNA glycosylase AlkD